MFFCTIKGNLIGSIQQDWSLLGPKYSILNSQGQETLTIKGPFGLVVSFADVLEISSFEFYHQNLQRKKLAKLVNLGLVNCKKPQLIPMYLPLLFQKIWM